ncbi:MAG TPA: hypothetical protein VGK20_15135 [Candidatus Binatia bacterium]
MDPDCADATVANCAYCNDVGSCASIACPANIDPADNSKCAVPGAWTCDPGFYADGFCDCGCGIVDPDCADATVASCQYCDDAGSCGTGVCPANIDSADNSKCTP